MQTRKCHPYRSLQGRTIERPVLEQYSRVCAMPRNSQLVGGRSGCTRAFLKPYIRAPGPGRAHHSMVPRHSHSMAPRQTTAPQHALVAGTPGQGQCVEGPLHGILQQRSRMVGGVVVEPAPAALHWYTSNTPHHTC